MHKSVLSLLMSLSLVTSVANANPKNSSSSSGSSAGGSSHSAPAQHSSPAPSHSAPIQHSQPAPSRPAPVQHSQPAPAPRNPAQHTQPAPAPRNPVATNPQPAPRNPTQHTQPAPAPRTPVVTKPQPDVKPSGQVNRQPAPTTPDRTHSQGTRQEPPPGVSATANRARTAKINMPTAPTSGMKGQPTVNKDRSVTERYHDGSSVRKGADGKVISQYDAKSHKTVYSNKDGSTTVAQGARSVRSYQNGDKVVRNGHSKEVSTYNAAKNQTVVRSPGKQIVIDHKSGIVNVRHGREQYQQVPHVGGRGYTRHVTINNVNVTRVYNYNYNRYGGYGLYYSPGIYVSAHYGMFVGGFYGGFGYLANAGYYVNHWGYGWSPWRTYPAEICWWGGCNYSGYGYYPYSPYSWRADYGYYYTPVVSIVNPIDYLLGTLISEGLENRRQARLEAEATERQEALDRQRELAEAASQDAHQAEVLRAQAAEELREAREERARNAAYVQAKSEPMSADAIEAQKNTINHITTEIAQKSGAIDAVEFLTSDKALHGFQIHDSLTVGIEGTDNVCNLDDGDVVAVKPGFVVTKDTDNVLVKVLSSVPGDCRPGMIVNMGVQKLQEALNTTAEKVNDAMNDMATKKMGQKK